MFYTLRMDEEEARWIVTLLRRVQLDSINDTHTVWGDDDVERAASFISRIRATIKAK
jgi:hypothetical protein